MMTIFKIPFIKILALQAQKLESYNYLKYLIIIIKIKVKLPRLMEILSLEEKNEEHV